MGETPSSTQQWDERSKLPRALPRFRSRRRFFRAIGERALCVIRKSRCKVQAQGSCSAPLHSFRRIIEKLGVILRFAAASFKISAGCG
jgi:hypothetical protein